MVQMNIKGLAIFASLFIATACIAAKPQVIADPQQVNDRFESFNRKMFAFNQTVDRVVILPVIKGYRAILPTPVRTGVSNVFNNIAMLPTIANNLLQGEPRQALKSTGRFLINSTIGLLGLFDVASQVNNEAQYQDFGLTLAKWGDKRSPYLVLPLIGPTTIRDIYGLNFDYLLFMPYPYINPLSVRYSVIGLRYLSLRADLYEVDQLVTDVALDPYTFQRDAYWQYRNNLMHQGTNSEVHNDYVTEGGEAEPTTVVSVPTAVVVEKKKITVVEKKVEEKRKPRSSF